MVPPMRHAATWVLCIDTGGTFTDCLALDPLGAGRRAKVLSTGCIRAEIAEILSPEKVRLRVRPDWVDDFPAGARLRTADSTHGGVRISAFRAREAIIECEGTAPIEPGLCEIDFGVEAPVLAAHLATRTPLTAPLPPMQLRLATTRGTNALLERRGARMALFITAGFADLLRIGTQQRPDLFALDIFKPQPLHDAVVEVDECIDARGDVLRNMDAARLRHEAANLVADGITTAAVALKNSYMNDAHERLVEGILREAGFTHITRSGAVAPLIRLLPRAETALVDAYLAPIIGGYLSRIAQRITSRATTMLTSAGGLTAASSYRPCESLLSGPAGGVAGAAAVARSLGEHAVLSFDMGGTSTDVARWAGDFEYIFEHTVGEARLLAPALAIESVAAGGGSVCWFDGHRLRVGPHSAGAAPGPACYGCGGPLAITDVNLLLGRVDATRFQVPLHGAAAEARCTELLAQVRAATGDAITRAQLLAGLLAIANQHMADAIARISLRRGFDPAEHALLAFGGAGGQHACAIADLLGIDRIILPADAGLLSAAGLFDARIERFAQRQVLRLFDELSAGEVAAIVTDLEREACDLVRADMPGDESIAVRRRLVEMRLLGQDSTLTIEFDDEASLTGRFTGQYVSIFGSEPAGRIEIESIRVIASTLASSSAVPQPPRGEAGHAMPPRTINMPSGEVRIAALVIDRESIAPGAVIAGPALIVDDHSTAVVEAGWSVRTAECGHLVVERGGAAEMHATIGRTSSRACACASESSPAALELFTSRFRAIVQDMGELLRRTAQSTNVKERLDFSCALLDADARLVANGSHIPVHLGAMGCCVRAVRQALAMQPGDVIITNHPAFGGSHLPDLTLMTPVHDGDDLIGYVANRAHHAEIGGTRPGSMPPAAHSLIEEGVVIPPSHVARRGRIDWSPVRRLLEAGPYPSRQVEMNLADLSAAFAANRHGAAALLRLAHEHGRDKVAHFMTALRRQAAEQMRNALERFGDGEFRAVEPLDDDSTLAVAITISKGSARVDFTGTAPTHTGNLNATPAIVHSAVMYVLRLLVNEPLPLNEGLLDDVEIILPPDTILNPRFDADPARCPAVVGGNTETSQRLVDTLIKALGLAACSQGTMNNVLFGNSRFGYYETICGGAGATATRDGADAVHTHMTNTRITDVEMLEHRYPVRVERFAIRRGSGGRGEHRGGDGAVREITFLEPMSLSVLTQHRARAPFSMRGGAPGAPGRQRLLRADGSITNLAPVDAAEVAPGDRLLIETPGGGGWGATEF